MDVLEKLKAICSIDETRQSMLTPYSVVWKGQRWAVGTNGQALAMVPYDGELRSDGPRVTDPAILPGPPSTHFADIAALRAWVGDVEPALVPCPKCKGTPPEKCKRCRGDGKIDASGECDCPHCPGDHNCPSCRNKPEKRGGCDLCDSTGKVTSGPRGGKLGVSLVDRNLLGRMLQSFPDVGLVEIGGLDEPGGAKHFRATGWIGVAMAIHTGGEPVRSDPNVPEFTAMQPLPAEKVG